MARLRLPSMNAIVTMAITLMVLFAIIRLAPLPDSFKSLFRV